MTTVMLTIEDVWLTDVADPSVSVRAASPERSSEVELDGEVRFYAGGRRRVITSARDTAKYPLTLQWLTDAQVATLTGWRGRVLLLRDAFGRRVFGSYLALDVKDVYVDGGRASIVSLTFTELTYSDAV